jgi:hypothetical protein
LVEGKRTGRVVHHGEGKAKGKEREERKGDGYKRGGIIGNMWMVGKRTGGVKSGDGRDSVAGDKT